MCTRQDILEAADAGDLLEVIAAIPRQQLESAAGKLSELHNCGEIDFLAYCEPSLLAAVSNHSFFAIQRVFCETLPHIDCSAKAAACACEHVFERAGNDLTAGLVYDSLTQWFRQNPVRAEEGLALIHYDPEAFRPLVRPLFLGGANHDVGLYVEEAFKLSNLSGSPVRLDALRTLGRITPIEDGRLLARTLTRLDEVLRAPVSDHDSAIVVDSALALLHRSDGRNADAVEPLLRSACGHRNPETRALSPTASCFSGATLRKQ